MYQYIRVSVRVPFVRLHKASILQYPARIPRTLFQLRGGVLAITTDVETSV